MNICIWHALNHYVRSQPMCSHSKSNTYQFKVPVIAKLVGLTWGPSGADRTQVGPMLAPWTLLSGAHFNNWPILAVSQTNHLCTSEIMVMKNGMECSITCWHMKQWLKITWHFWPFLHFLMTLLWFNREKPPGQFADRKLTEHLQIALPFPLARVTSGFSHTTH